MTIYEKIAEFNTTAGTIQYTEQTVPEDIVTFREALITEEYNELLAGIASGDKVEQLDALADLIVVVSGFAWVISIPLPFVQGYDLNSPSIVNRELPLILRYKAIFMTAHYLDLLDSLHEAVDRVHLSNMSKFCKTEQEAIDTVASYKEKEIETYHKLVGELYVIYRTSDNKILKSINYTPVDLKDLV